MVNSDHYYAVKSANDQDLKKGASFIPDWVHSARCRGNHVRMHELEYWINCTERVSLNKKITGDGWAQVKIFNLPKNTLKLQAKPEHLDVLLSTVKYMKPRKDYYDKYVHILIELNGERILTLNRLYGRFDDSKLSEDFKLLRKADHEEFHYFVYIFKSKYNVSIFKCKFDETQ